ncbi:hypothetical protein QFC22_002501 [Naganishia vaughanmartiniae]|uniref:Uncharacterized protein n=1 Tax=Naganishia vaughanmartiniae TaxID=1424756 RepID=A0ACC2XCW3_9TREE|nr:hypothetical protein QFC22_002501 [Naganishia vaughanmartiniae]
MAAASTSQYVPAAKSSSQPPVVTSQANDLPPVLPRTHGIHVATLTLRAHHPSVLTQFSSFALHAAHSLGMPVSRPAALPVTRSLYTVLKSPFVHKKAQENFEKKYHARVIKVWDTERDVVDKWLRYLKKYSIGGVGMKAVVFDWVAVDGVQDKSLEQSSTTDDASPSTTGSDASVTDKVLAAVEGLTRDLKEEVQHATEKAQEVVQQMTTTPSESASSFNTPSEKTDHEKGQQL